MINYLITYHYKNSDLQFCVESKYHSLLLDDEIVYIFESDNPECIVDKVEIFEGE